MQQPEQGRVTHSKVRQVQSGKSVIVVGGGFSGLISSYYLVRAGYQVDLYEKGQKLGGLIDTENSKWGLAETAACSIINSYDFEELCKELNLAVVTQSKVSKARFLFRKRPRKWPLSIIETGGLLLRSCWKFVSGGKEAFRPKSLESVAQWGERIFGKAFVNYIIGPALQGIYAGQASQLSASLILGRFFKAKEKIDGKSQRDEKLKYGGTIAPKLGMKNLIDSLRFYLERAGVNIHINQELSPSDIGEFYATPIVLSTNVQEAGEWLDVWYAQQKENIKINKNMIRFAQRLKTIKLVPMVTATVFYDKSQDLLPGFGCLFPRGEGVRSLGVLFNSQTFEGRSEKHSETWMIGDEGAASVTDLTDRDVKNIIANDRRSLYGAGPANSPLGQVVTRWKKSVPYYDRDLEVALKDFEVPVGIFLVGNYLGGIGLSKILGQAKELPQVIEKQYTRGN